MSIASDGKYLYAHSNIDGLLKIGTGQLGSSLGTVVAREPQCLLGGDSKSAIVLIRNDKLLLHSAAGAVELRRCQDLSVEFSSVSFASPFLALIY